MTATINAPKGVGNFEWLEAVAAHPKTTIEDETASFEFIGIKTDRTQEQLDASTFRLLVYGFLRVVDISDDGRTYTYEPVIPEPPR